MVYFEVVSNSNLDVIDVSAAAAAAHEAGALVVVDNTFLTPYLMRPLEHGADVVVYSATKYLSGHGDALGGFVLGNDEEFRARIHRMRILMGGVLSPMNAFLIMRGIKTLPMRMERHQANALKVASFLESHPKVAEVAYLGLKSFAGHERAAAQMRGFGGMMRLVPVPSFDYDAFNRSLRMCKPWYSLGDVETLILSMRDKGCLRVSVGLEDPEDIIADIDQALARA
jgi:methionine-gamma-lyase